MITSNNAHWRTLRVAARKMEEKDPKDGHLVRSAVDAAYGGALRGEPWRKHTEEESRLVASLFHRWSGDYWPDGEEGDVLHAWFFGGREEAAERIIVELAARYRKERMAEVEFFTNAPVVYDYGATRTLLSFKIEDPESIWGRPGHNEWRKVAVAGSSIEEATSRTESQKQRYASGLHAAGELDPRVELEQERVRREGWRREREEQNVMLAWAQVPGRTAAEIKSRKDDFDQLGLGYMGAGTAALTPYYKALAAAEAREKVAAEEADFRHKLAVVTDARAAALAEAPPGGSAILVAPAESRGGRPRYLLLSALPRTCYADVSLVEGGRTVALKLDDLADGMGRYYRFIPSPVPEAVWLRAGTTVEPEDWVVQERATGTLYGYREHFTYVYKVFNADGRTIAKSSRLYKEFGED